MDNNLTWDQAVDTLTSMCVDTKLGKGPTKQAFVLALRLYADEMDKLIRPGNVRFIADPRIRTRYDGRIAMVVEETDETITLEFGMAAHGWPMRTFFKDDVNLERLQPW